MGCFLYRRARLYSSKISSNQVSFALSTSSKLCFEQPAISFLVYPLIFIEYYFFFLFFINHPSPRRARILNPARARRDLLSVPVFGRRFWEWASAAVSWVSGLAARFWAWPCSGSISKLERSNSGFSSTAGATMAPPCDKRRTTEVRAFNFNHFSVHSRNCGLEINNGPAWF